MPLAALPLLARAGAALALLGGGVGLRVLGRPVVDSVDPRDITQYYINEWNIYNYCCNARLPGPDARAAEHAVAVPVVGVGVVGEPGAGARVVARPGELLHGLAHGVL